MAQDYNYRQEELNLEEYAGEETLPQAKTKGQLNFYTVTAIKKSMEESGRFENLNLVNCSTLQGRTLKKEGHSSFVFKANDGITGRKSVLKFLDPLFSAGAEGLFDIDKDLDYEKLFEWEDRVLEFLKNNTHSVTKIQKLSQLPLEIETDGKVFSHKAHYIALENLNIELKKAFFDEKNTSLQRKSSLMILFCRILTAVQALHKAGIFHRDLKPSNLMAKSGNSNAVILIDFASSSVIDEVRDKIKMYPQKWHGTDDYAAPEIECGLSPEGVLAPAQDIYSLGCMLYELFARDTFSQKLHETNPCYIETIENCRIYNNDGVSHEERIKTYGSYLDRFASSIRPVSLCDESGLPPFVREPLNKIIHQLTDFDWRKRPLAEDFNDIKKKLEYLSKALKNAHLLKISKERRQIHKMRLIESRKKSRSVPEAE